MARDGSPRRREAPGEARPAWHVLTGEYPPADGGVSDYTRAIAAGLAAAGDEVHVWAPPAGAGLARDPGVTVHPLPLGYAPRGLRALSRALGEERSPRRLLVQYVPQAFGLSGVNVPFCAWLAGVRDAEVFVMFHEVAVPWEPRRRWKQNAAAAAMRAMGALLMARADRVFVSTSSWEPILRALSVRRTDATWIPIPSNVPTRARDGARAAVRAKLGIDPDAQLVGHFGTYGGQVAPLVRRALRDLLEGRPRRAALLVGRGGAAFARELCAGTPLAARVEAAGDLDAADVADYLSACDVVVQAYPDGVSTRRTTAMAALALGVSVATNEGHLTEPLWRESGAVEIADAAEGVAGAAERILADPARAAARAERGQRLYAERFSLERSIAALRA